MDEMGSTGGRAKIEEGPGVGGPTLWDLAHAIREETERVFGDEQVVWEVTNLLLLHVIETRVKNVYVEEDVRDRDFWPSRSGE